MYVCMYVCMLPSCTHSTHGRRYQLINAIDLINNLLRVQQHCLFTCDKTLIHPYIEDVQTWFGGCFRRALPYTRKQ